MQLSADYAHGLIESGINIYYKVTPADLNPFTARSFENDP